MSSAMNTISQEASTPIISNRVSPPLGQLPTLELTATAAASSSFTHRRNAPRVARFSSPDEAPIIMTSLANNAVIKTRNSSDLNYLSASRWRDNDSDVTRQQQQGYAATIRPFALVANNGAHDLQNIMSPLLSELCMLGMRSMTKYLKRIRRFLLQYCSSYAQALMEEVAAARLYHLSSERSTRSSRPRLQAARYSLAPRPNGGSGSGRPTVKGLPNFGQTCFLNSVLQCLAALDPFLTYLFHITCLLEEQNNAGEVVDHDEEIDDHDESGWQPLWNQHEQPSSSKPILVPELLDLLIAINGHRQQSSNSRLQGKSFIDPRSILLAVSRDHVQFRNNQAFHSQQSAATLEQQDAQELLQALLDMIVQAAGLDATSSVVPYFINAEILEERGAVEGESAWLEHIQGNADDEILTAASGAKEALKPVTSRKVVDDAKNEHYFDCSPISSDVVSNGLAHNCHDYSGRSTESSQSDSDDEYLSTTQDEKKEEYVPHIPHVDSEESVLSHQMPAIHVDYQRDDNVSPLATDSICSTATSRERKLSAAMRMMLSSTTSLTPSPFCGWLGSSLQCSACKHVRPIQNAPFFDVPVIPTAVSNYLTGSARGSRYGGTEPIKYSPTSLGPPCTLEEMLLQFTEVECVSDVECRNCTMQREINNLEEEISFLEQGIQAKLSRAKRQPPSEGEDPTKQFRADLEMAQYRMNAYKSTSPDEEGALESVFAFDNPLVDTVSPELTVERKDAFKRLLFTRLPSIFAIHVQRRFFDPLTNRMSKTAQHVVFPEYLDVSPYCVYGGGPDDDTAGWAGSSFSSPGYGSRSSIIFRLQALIEHHGGAFSGHYVSYRRDLTSGSWLHISDDVVRPVSWEQVRTRQAYMLFYEAV